MGLDGFDYLVMATTMIVASTGGSIGLVGW
jgi:hypothetical protein